MKQYIYADNAATTQMDKNAYDAMTPYLIDDYGNASQPYAFARYPKKALQEARETIASCIGASPNEIYFTSGGTESDNWVIKGVASSDGNKRLIVTSSFEHHAVLNSCNAMERIGNQIVYVQPSKEGIITVDALKKQLKSKADLVSVMMVNNELGTIQPIEELCAYAHSKGTLFHTDAIQAVGHMPINVKELNVDYLSASAHKFNGMKGCGFLYMREGSKIIPYVDGGLQERGYRAGTENIAGIVAMATALRNNCDLLQENINKIKEMERRLLDMLSATGFAFIRNGGDRTLPGLISLSFPGIDGEVILHRMDLMGICISTGSACNSKDTEVSHVLKAIKLEEKYAKGTIRISLGKYNTQEDVEKIVIALEKILKSV